MTKEEYERLLKSDYWKGYSYSLIKERNYTCQDCGRSFPGQRNKLQVHHLHYRDANPWSYDPDEVVVLCVECHRRRHGLGPQDASEYEADMRHTKTYERHEGAYSSYSYGMGGLVEKLGRYLRKYWFLIVFAGCVLALIYVINPGDDVKSSTPESIETRQSDNNQGVFENPVAHRTRTSTTKKESQEAGTITDVLTTEDEVNTVGNSVEDVSIKHPETKVTDNQKSNERSKTTLELHEERTHANAVESAKRAGVSTEGTTSEILERITHANAVKSAKRAGVSTEGTTSEILERITHANAVKSAQRAGVSTEGTTSEILERITHANAVKSAKRAGVSTEGTTSEILERISRKHLEER